MRALSILTLCALTVINVANGQTGSSGQPPDVYLITIDTLRADHVHSYGDKDIQTPALDDLARHGIRFAQAFTPTPITNSSHASILTGLLPSGHGVTDFARPLVSESPTWAEFLKKRGYQTAAFIGAVILDSKALAPGLDRGFDFYDNFPERSQTKSRWGRVERRGTEVVRRAEAWQDAHPMGPHFVWVLCMIPTTRMSLPRLIPRSTKTDCMMAKLPLPIPRWQILSAISSSVAGTRTR